MRSLRLQKLFGQLSARSQRSRKHAKPQWRPQVETMEGRTLMSTLSLSNGVLTYQGGNTHTLPNGQPVTTPEDDDLTISAYEVTEHYYDDSVNKWYTYSSDYVHIKDISGLDQTYDQSVPSQVISSIDVSLDTPANGQSLVFVDEGTIFTGTIPKGGGSPGFVFFTGSSLPVQFPVSISESNASVEDQVSIFNGVNSSQFDIFAGDINFTNTYTDDNISNLSFSNTGIGLVRVIDLAPNSRGGTVFNVFSTSVGTSVLLANDTAGVDTFNLGNAAYSTYPIPGSSLLPPYTGSLDDIAAPVQIFGGPADQVNIDDSNSSANTNTYQVGSDSLVRHDYGTSTPPATIDYFGIGTAGLVTINGGPNSDVFYVQNIETPTMLIGGAGGTTFGMFDNSGRSSVHPLTLVGQSGHDWLNYNSYVGPAGSLNAVTVNLTTSTPSATGTAAISGINNVLGSPGPGTNTLTAGSGNDVLVGGSTGTNVLEGGVTGNDVMIGGSGTDILIAGGGYDLMIAGTTIYDYNLYQLTAIGTKWDLVNNAQSLQYAYTEFSSPAIGSGYYALNTSTVTGNNSTNVFVGVGADDWAFYNPSDVGYLPASCRTKI